MKNILLVFLAFFGSIKVYSQSNDKEIITQLTKTFQTKNIESLKTTLSATFSVAVYTMPSALNRLKTIVSRFPCDSVALQKKQKNAKVLAVSFYNKGKLKEKGNVYLDDSNKIKYIDAFDKLYGMNRNAHSKLVAKIPFETDEHGSVYLNVKLNNSTKTLRLLFDTGADGMALRKSLADSLGIKVSHSQNASVVGGNMQVDISKNNTVYLGDFAIPNQSIALFKDIRGHMDGIIGNTLARLYIVKVDYDKKELSLYSFGDFKSNKKGHSVAVTMPEGLIIIPGTVAVNKDKPKSGQFVFDLGAAYSLICFRPFVKHNRLLVDGFVPEYQGSTTSMGMTTPTFTGRAAYFSFAHLDPMKNMPVTLMSGGGQSESWKPGFDGSIGTRIISRYNFVINLQQKEIVFTPNKNFDYPYDFALGGFLFGFDTNGVLRVQSRVGQPNEKVDLPVGSAVISINGIKASVLRDELDKMSKILTSSDSKEVIIQYESNNTKGSVKLAK